MKMEWGYVGAVVLSGLVIVFVGLILLIAAVWVMGCIFRAIEEKKTKSSEVISDSSEERTNVAQAPKELPIANSSVSEDEQIISVIAAAVAAVSEETGVPLQIKSIKPARVRKSSRNSWAAAAAAEATRPF